MAEYFDPHAGHLFKVTIDGIDSGRFQEVSGLSMELELDQISEGGASYPHKFVKGAKYGDITFKRGFFNNPALFEWFEKCAQQSLTERKNGSIILHGDDKKPVCQWDFYRAFPKKWEGPSFNAASSAIAFESLTLYVEYFEINTEAATQR